MIITIRGDCMYRISIHGLKNRKLRGLMRQAASYFIEELIGSRPNLKVKFKFSGLKAKCGVLGECSTLDEGYRPRNFTINIDDAQTLRMQLRTIAHELVHVKQYARNEMYEYVSQHTRWRNTVVDESKTRYKDLPWEREAYSMEVPLVRKFLKEHKIKLKEYV